MSDLASPSGLPSSHSPPIDSLHAAAAVPLPAYSPSNAQHHQHHSRHNSRAPTHHQPHAASVSISHHSPGVAPVRVDGSARRLGQGNEVEIELDEGETHANGAAPSQSSSPDVTSPSGGGDSSGAPSTGTGTGAGSRVASAARSRSRAGRPSSAAASGRSTRGRGNKVAPELVDDGEGGERATRGQQAHGRSKSEGVDSLITREFDSAPRSTVFTGRPGTAELESTVDDHRAEAEDELEDKRVRRSKFHRQRSIIDHIASTHRIELLVATFNVLIHLATILTDLMLLADYSEHDQNKAAAGLAGIRIIVGCVELEYEFLNNGWQGGRFLCLAPFIFFNLRIVVDYVEYVGKWLKYRNKNWSNSDFRAGASFHTLIASLPSLIVQTYVMMVDPRPMQQVWLAAYIITILSGSIDLLHHFAYVAVENGVYLGQFLKALISTGLRTALVAQLLDIIGQAVMGWMIVSFLIGLGMYYMAVLYSRRHDRDNPLEKTGLYSHLVFGGHVSATVLFVAIPFAPSHSVYDWWLGYLLCEAKMAFENFIMLIVVLTTIHSQYPVDLFYSVLTFTLICYIGQLFATVFLHQRVKLQLNKRNIYSATQIVKLWAHFLHYYKERWYPESLDEHPTAQNHLLYQDQHGHVPKHLKRKFEREVELERRASAQRRESLNSQLISQHTTPQFGSQANPKRRTMDSMQRLDIQVEAKDEEMGQAQQGQGQGQEHEQQQGQDHHDSQFPHQTHP